MGFDLTDQALQPSDFGREQLTAQATETVVLAPGILTFRRGGQLLHDAQVQQFFEVVIKRPWR